LNELLEHINPISILSIHQLLNKITCDSDSGVANMADNSSPFGKRHRWVPRFAQKARRA